MLHFYYQKTTLDTSFTKTTIQRTQQLNSEGASLPEPRMENATLKIFLTQIFDWDQIYMIQVGY